MPYRLLSYIPVYRIQYRIDVECVGARTRRSPYDESTKALLLFATSHRVWRIEDERCRRHRRRTKLPAIFDWRWNSISLIERARRRKNKSKPLLLLYILRSDFVWSVYTMNLRARHIVALMMYSIPGIPMGKRIVFIAAAAKSIKGK